LARGMPIFAQREQRSPRNAHLLVGIHVPPFHSRPIFPLRSSLTLWTSCSNPLSGEVRPFAPFHPPTPALPLNPAFRTMPGSGIGGNSGCRLHFSPAPH
jgi:hypothetical protein